MKHFLIVLVLAVVALSCDKTKEKAPDETAVKKDTVERPPVTLTLKWETDTVLTTNESVLYDKERDVIYVANINGAPDAKDNNGFISKLSTDGKVTELKWVTKLHAPKGMGLSDKKLFVADIDRVVEIDVTNGKITKSYPVKGAAFLNDVTVDNAGVVYISDTGTGTIVKLEKGKISNYMENVQGGPNGLLAEDGRMMLLTFQGQTVSTVDSAKQVTTRATGIENLDGVEAMGDGGYLLSSWNGMVHYIDKDWKNYTILDTRADSVSAADIDYIQEKNLLLVPTFFHNTVRAYEVSK